MKVAESKSQLVIKLETHVNNKWQAIERMTPKCTFAPEYPQQSNPSSKKKSLSWRASKTQVISIAVPAKIESCTEDWWTRQPLHSLLYVGGAAVFDCGTARKRHGSTTALTKPSSRHFEVLSLLILRYWIPSQQTVLLEVSSAALRKGEQRNPTTAFFRLWYPQVL